MARLSGWLEETGLPPSALTPRVVADRRAAFPGLGPVLRFLRGIGVVPDADDVTEDTPVDRVLGEFGAWLVAERGLAAGSVRCYVSQARPFLASLPRPLEVALEGLDAGAVTSFMLDRCRDRNVWSAKAAVTALRSLLRFLHVAGHVPSGWPRRCRRWPGGGWLVCLVAGGRPGRAAVGSCDVGTVVGRRTLRS